MQEVRRNDPSQSHLIKEVQIIPVKPTEGIVGFASFVFNNSLYLGSIAIVTRPEGGFRLLYPTKKVGGSSLNVFHPVNRKVGDYIEQIVLEKYQEVMTKARADAYQT